MFLEHLDTVIAFAAMMLLLSLLITMAVQLVVSLLGIRGQNLVWGVEQLIREVDPEAFDEDARMIAEKALTHPVLATTTNWLLKAIDWGLERFGRQPRFNRGKRPPTAVRVKELVLALDWLRRTHQLEGREINEALDRLLPTKPEASRADAAGSVSMESSTTEDGSTSDRSDETPPAPANELERRLGEWFDVVMDATSERFKLRTRWATGFWAVLLVFGWQVNSVDILQRLSEDPELRATVIAQIDSVRGLYERIYEAESGSPPSPDEGGDEEVEAPTPTGEAENEVEAVAATVETIMDEIYRTELVPISTTYWTDIDREAPLRGIASRLAKDLPAKLATVLLLSLGAPFWYRILNDFVGFRSVVARKGDGEQAKPQSSA